MDDIIPYVNSLLLSNHDCEWALKSIGEYHLTLGQVKDVVDASNTPLANRFFGHELSVAGLLTKLDPKLRTELLVSNWLYGFGSDSLPKTANALRSGTDAGMKVVAVSACLRDRTAADLKGLTFTEVLTRWDEVGSNAIMQL
jgi:hypothetical protein